MSQKKLKSILRLNLLLFIFVFSQWSDAEEKHASTWVPILGGTSTYGFFAGASYLRYPQQQTGDFLSLRLMATTNPFWNLGVTYKKWQASGWNYRTSWNYSGWYDPYYGEGNQTDESKRVDIRYHYMNFSQQFLKKWGDHLYVGGFVEDRYREERGTLDSPTTRYFPQENTWGLGLMMEWDSRNHRFSPNQGQFHTVKLTAVPKGNSNLKDQDAFYQLEADLRYYKSILKNKVWAVKAIMAATEGDPTYTYRYSLGGPFLLRGFQKNRFRGEKYYALQNEIRAPLNKRFSMAGFIEAGDVTDDRWGKVLWSYGLGLRIGLPPDQQMKLRLDLGFSEDQTSFSFLFGEAW